MTIEPEIIDEDGRKTEVFPLPIESAYLEELLTYVFEQYWEDIVFGPILPGAAFEFRCPGPPKKIGTMDGYLTVHFGGTHFHLCIGHFSGVDAAEATRRRTLRAEMFRGFDKHDHPTTWGLRLFNGADQPQMSVFFPNPFLADDTMLDEPDWSRLACWEDMQRRYLGREPDGRDRLGRGFGRER